MTGTREPRIAPAMARVESSSPPGVSSSTSSACAPSELALAMARSSSSRGHRLDGVGENELVDQRLLGAAPAGRTAARQSHAAISKLDCRPRILPMHCLLLMACSFSMLAS